MDSKLFGQFISILIECVDNNGEPRVLHGKKKDTLDRMVIAMQAKRSHRKGCKLFAVHISSDKGKEVEDAEVLRRYPVLQHFKDVFLETLQSFHLTRG